VASTWSFELSDGIPVRSLQQIENNIAKVIPNNCDLRLIFVSFYGSSDMHIIAQNRAYSSSNFPSCDATTPRWREYYTA
jgi:hypothetical protein